MHLARIIMLKIYLELWLEALLQGRLQGCSLDGGCSLLGLHTVYTLWLKSGWQYLACNSRLMQFIKPKHLVDFHTSHPSWALLK